jgi:hypothetical protein
VYGILGEDDSDVQTLKVLVKRLAGNESLRVKTKGYGGCGEMLRKGARQLQLFRSLNMTRFIVCYDADGPDPEPKRQLVVRKIAEPSGLESGWCVVVPVQELEAWILADIECAVNIFPSWRPSPIDNPEAIPEPKEFVEKLSRDSRKRPRYSHAIHNEKMALHLDLKKVAAKCPAFKVLRDFVCPANRN